MRITDTIATQTASKIKDKKKANSSTGGDFGAMLDGAEDTSQSSGALSTGAITIPNMVGLQLTDEQPSNQERHIQHGETLLSQLDELRMMLLSGNIHPRAAENLARELQANVQGEYIPPVLQEILDEIELRAAVELAKLERAGH